MKIPKGESLEIVLTIVFCQLVIESIDKLSFTRFFREKVKRVATQLIKLLEPKVNALFEIEGTDSDGAADQLGDVSYMVLKLSLAVLYLDNIHATTFQNGFKMLLERCHMDKQIIDYCFEL